VKCTTPRDGHVITTLLVASKTNATTFRRTSSSCSSPRVHEPSRRCRCDETRSHVLAREVGRPSTTRKRREKDGDSQDPRMWPEDDVETPRGVQVDRHGVLQSARRRNKEMAKLLDRRTCAGIRMVRLPRGNAQERGVGRSPHAIVDAEGTCLVCRAIMCQLEMGAREFSQAQDASTVRPRHDPQRDRHAKGTIESCI